MRSETTHSAGRIEARPRDGWLRPGLRGRGEGRAGDGLAAGRDAQGAELRLDARSEQEEVHDLGDPGAGEAVPTGDFGVVALLAGVEVVRLADQDVDTTGPLLNPCWMVTPKSTA